MRLLLAVILTSAFILTPQAGASDAGILAAADRGTPKTQQSTWTVSQHVRKAKEIIAYAFRHKSWRDGHDFTKKRKRRVERHKQTIQGAPRFRFKINQHIIAKRQSFKKYAKRMEAQADPFKTAWANMSDYDRTWAVQIGSCESGNNPSIVGHYLGAMQFLSSTWNSALATLPSRLRANVGSVPQAEPLITQYVVAIHWRNRTSTAQWPACSRKFGYL